MVDRKPSLKLEETVRHGDMLHRREVEVWRLTDLTLKGVLMSSIYPSDDIAPEHLKRMMDQLKVIGCTYLGWADFRVIYDPQRDPLPFAHWSEVLYPEGERTDAVRAARVALGYDPEGRGTE